MISRRLLTIRGTRKGDIDLRTCHIGALLLWIEPLILNNKENIVFKDAIGVKGLRFKFYGNHHGNPKQIKQLYLSEYQHRLRSREIAPGFESLRKLKDILWIKRLETIQDTFTPDWTMQWNN